VKLLVLGGTVFLGRHVVHVARARGPEVTLFNRGKSDPHAFSDVETILGDRKESLDALRGRSWDAVVDTCGYVPRVVAASARALAGSVAHYTFISSGSVYENFAGATDERSAVGTLADPTVEEVTGETYGPLKALCEQAAEASIPGRVLNVRAGLIVGPNDPSDRFTYWPHRIARGGDVLAPDRKEMNVQFIDVRDLAGWIIGCAERTVTGVFNATGPVKPLAFAPFLEACRRTTGSDARIEWVDEKFLLEHEVGPWMELPLWIPEEDLRMECAKAFEKGLTTRPVEETIRDTLAWAASRPAERPWRAGMDPEKERKLLAAWRAR
jgi:2'-hydroxyisoflavone reductase